LNQPNPQRSAGEPPALLYFDSSAGAPFLPISSKPWRGGFSLIELMVVLVIIGIMSAMILPEMTGTFEDLLLRSTARKLVDVCQLASSRAITLGQLHVVQLDPKTGKYVIQRPVRDREEGGGLVPVKDVPGSEGELDTRISVEIRKPGDLPRESESTASPVAEEESETPDKSQGLAFYPDGTANRMEIRLRDRQGFGLVLSINPVTARLHISDLERE